MFMQFYACFYLFSFIKCMKLSGKLAREDRPIRIMSAYSRSYTVRQEESSCSDMNDWVHFDLLPKWQVLDRIYESAVAHAEQTAVRQAKHKKKRTKKATQTHARSKFISCWVKISICVGKREKGAQCLCLAENDMTFTQNKSIRKAHRSMF